MAPKKVKYKDKQIEVTIPIQDTEVEVKILPVEMEDKMYKDKKFKPLRVVTNFEIRDKKNKPFTKFKKPFEFKLRYTKKDFDQAAKDGRPLRMAYWKNGQWNIFTAQKHNFELLPDPNVPFTGVGVVQITDWDDPAIAWGG